MLTVDSPHPACAIAVPAPPFSPPCSPALAAPQIPWWLLVAFGAFSLTSLGLGLLRFHDTPEAYESLLAEIAQAKNELRDQGVEVD